MVDSGLILVETWDDSNKACGYVTSSPCAFQVSKQVKDQAKALLRKLHNMPPRCSVEGRAFQSNRFLLRSCGVRLPLHHGQWSLDSVG